MDSPVSTPPCHSRSSRTTYGLSGFTGSAALAPSTTRWPSSLGPAPAGRRTGASTRTPRTAISALVPTLTPYPLEHVGGIDDRALARVVDQSVLYIQRVGRDHTLDQVLLAGTVQRQPEPAAVHLAALRDERLERVVDVVLAREGGVARGGEAPGGQTVQRSRAVEVDRRLEALAQRPGRLQDRHETHR